MKLEQRGNVISFPQRQEVTVIGNNALKLDLAPVEIPPVLAPVIDIESHRVKKKDKKPQLVYDPEFDRRDYRDFHLLSKEKQRELIAYTHRQMETYIGERLNAVESRTRWNIVDGKIIPEGIGVPLEVIIENGVNFRKNAQNPNVIDLEREEAELEGFRKTQKRLTSPDTQIGAINLSVSPPGEEGSDYKRKFFDVFMLREDENGRYIEAVRYLSASEIEDYEEKLSPFKKFEGTPTAVDFLRDPIEIDGVFEDPSEIQAYLSGGIKALEAQKLAQINDMLFPLRMSYINSLINNPNAVLEHNLRHNAHLNEADNILSALDKDDQKLIRAMRNFAAFAPAYLVEQKIQILGRQQVRNVSVPCPGTSGGLEVGSAVNPNLGGDPFSVSEYGRPPLSDVDKAKKDPNLCKMCGGEPHFHCPGKTERGKSCNSIIQVGKGISSCYSCGEGKKC